MDRRTGQDVNKGVAFKVVKGGVLAVALGWSAIGVAQTAPAAKTVPDAQVEASVLKALAGTPDLANQPMTTTTVYGVVTLSGSVQTEAQRTEAETIVSRTSGVQKVVDEMTLSSEAANAQPAQDSGAPAADAQGTNPNLQSDGTMAPAQPAPQGSPDSNNTQPPSQTPNSAPSQAGGPSVGPGAPEYRQPYYPGGYGPPPNYGQQAPANGAPAQAPLQGYQIGRAHV